MKGITMYETQALLRRELRVHYPAGRGRVALRSEFDWERDVPPLAVSDDGTMSTFALEARRPFVYFKAVLIGDDGGARWCVGPRRRPSWAATGASPTRCISSTA